MLATSTLYNLKFTKQIKPTTIAFKIEALNTTSISVILPVKRYIKTFLILSKIFLPSLTVVLIVLKLSSAIITDKPSLLVFKT